MNRHSIVFAGLSFLICFSMPAKAQETSANFGQGSVIVGFDNRACDASLVGALRYHSANGCLEKCGGAEWACTTAPTCTNDSTARCILDATRSAGDAQFTSASIKSGVNILGITGSYSGAGGCTAPSLCPSIGNVCDDGNAGNNPDPKFAGFVVYGTSCEPLYVSQNVQSTGSQWKTATGTNDIATDSSLDGKINDGQVPDSGTFPAFKLCKDLAEGGFTDWYLPARNELDSMLYSRTAIGGFMGAEYWSSTELNNNNAWYIHFTNEDHVFNSKPNNYDVRCVRRD